MARLHKFIRSDTRFNWEPRVVKDSQRSGMPFPGDNTVSIGNLSKLDTLDLSHNYLFGKIPSSIGNLFRLTYLVLSWNKFTPGTLHWVSKLSNLQILDLSNDNLFGMIPSSLQNLTHLEGLWLNVNQLTGEIPSWLGNFTKLNYLYIYDNQLQGSIPNSIFQLLNIQSIGFRSNNLTGSLRFDTFLQSKHLLVLQLSKNQLSLVSTSYANATLPKFRFLGLGNCNLSEFPSFLHSQHELVALVLYNNNIKGYLPDWILNLQSLSILDLNHNFLTSFERFKETPVFCGLTPLYILDMSSNNLTGDLPPCFGEWGSSGMYLNLRNNSLSGEIPDNFQNDCGLKVIDLSQNRIKGGVPKSLPNCSMLEILNLGENQMNGVFPHWLGGLEHLKVLSLRSNKFRGGIGLPLSKLEFNRLQIIDLSDNSFTGRLPLEYFGNWAAMKSVDSDLLEYMEISINFVVDNLWSFRYSYFIRIVNKGMQRSFEKILEFFVAADLSSNMFEGEIPENIGNLRALKSLNLSNNFLTGRIPLSLGNLQDLEALDLSVNELSGYIPAQLTLLNFLSFFNVSNNNLTGPVPRGKQFGTFQNDSFLSNPGLCGPPLSNTCETLPLAPLKDGNEDSFELHWGILLLGVGFGFVGGVAIGCVMDLRKYEWLIKKFVRH